MAAVTGKRKRENGHVGHVQSKKAATIPHSSKSAVKQVNSSIVKPAVVTKQPASTDTPSIQIVTGSYERVLHGICASIPSKLLDKSTLSGDRVGKGESFKARDGVTFSDSFLFAAHSSSIRCLALSPSTDSGKRMLATGSSDERINLYSLSTAPPPSLPSSEGKPSAAPYDETPTAVNSRNQSLGNLIHHERAVTRLQFPTKSKLFSAAEDNTVAVSRTRDWTVLSSIKAPIPKPQGRPSGDTAGPGEVPAGINDFAIHPSQKLMLSVGRGERCMRLWNLMTGKKAGVLNFDRTLLGQIGEGKHSSGEGRRVLWSNSGEAFVVAFERGLLLYGVDSKPRAIVRPSPSTKIHQIRYLPRTSTSTLEDVLAISTEDGRILFFDTSIEQDPPETTSLPTCKCIGVLGGPAAGVSGRMKDFDVLILANNEGEELYLLSSGSSDGAVRLWALSASELGHSSDTRDAGAADAADGTDISNVGRLMGLMETGNRITCLVAFAMDGRPEMEVEDELSDPEKIVEGSSSDSEA